MTQTAAAMLIALGAGWYFPAPCVVGRAEIAASVRDAFAEPVSRGAVAALSPAPFASGGYVLPSSSPSRGVPLADPVTILPELPGASAPGSFPVEVPKVPLPASLWLLLSAVAGLALLRRRA